MALHSPGDVVLPTLPFTGGAGMKRRPAVVLLDLGDADVIVVPVTSQPARSAFDVLLVEWREAGLHLPSIARTDKPATVDRRLVMRTLRTLTAVDWGSVRVKTRELWSEL